MQTVTLHQSLHGYADGHRALGSSIELSAQDAKTLLILSDVSGPGLRLDSSGYLTGYPLPNSGLYAFARTWPAPEMPRPGCVWTHTLLIDFADLATIADPSRLLRLFQRPDKPAADVFKKTVAFDEKSQVTSVDKHVASFAKPLIAALYQHPSKPVISFEEGSETSEMAVLALWAQQWPRLRRSFRFCTLASSDRSTKETPFDLQLLPRAMPSSRSRFSNAIDASIPEMEPDWLRIAVDDLITSRPDGLRQFLYQAGSDLQNGRSSFANLCCIFDLLEGAPYAQPDVETALELIPKPSDASTARALKGVVVRRLFKQDKGFSRPVLSYMVDHLDLLDSRSANEDTNGFGQSLLKAQPRLFFKMRRNGDFGEKIFHEVLASAPTKDILTAAKRVSGLLPHALQSRTELLQQPETWSLIDASDTKTLDRLVQLDKSQDALRAAITAERLDLAAPLLDRAGRLEMLTALHQAFAGDGLNNHSLRQWLEAIATPGVVSDFFSSQKQIDRHFLLAVSQYYSPDDIPSDSERDPWLRAIEASKNALSDQDELSLRSYLLTRALGDHAYNSAELAQFGFEATDRALADNRLPYPLWSRLEKRLPWSMFWPERDKCRRLRRGLVEHCVDNRWPADDFVNLTRDDELFAILVSIADESYRGRQYLKAIKDVSKGVKDSFTQKQRAIVKHILKGY